MGLQYIVIDNDHALSTGLPLKDLIKDVCVNCGEPVFLTRKQFDAYARDPAVTPPLKFACVRCEEAKRKAKQNEGLG